MRAAYLECFAGVAGDMLLGALVDAGVDPGLLQDAASATGLGARLSFERVDRSGIQSTKARVLVHGKDADGGLPEEQQAHEHTHTHTHTHVVDGVPVTHTHTHTHHEHGHGQAAGQSHAHSHEHTHEPAHSHSHVHGRSLSEIRALIEKLEIAGGAKQIALDAFRALGVAEAKIHGVPVEEVHFHEVGAVDAIVDIVCGAVGAHSLGADAWYASPVNTGSGFVDCAHGKYPVPAPATEELLRGVPVYADGPAKELTTPTGAAMLRALGCRFGKVPVLEVTKTGYGAGTRNPEGFPNVLRLRLGEVRSDSRDRSGVRDSESDVVAVLECAIDDASPEVLAHAAQQLLEHGAMDVMQQAVVMKKGRQGVLLTVLCRPEHAAAMEALLFRETTTLGVRRREESRTILRRDTVEVATEYGVVRVKLGWRGEALMNIAPEFEDCRRAALKHQAPLKDVMRASAAAAAHPHESLSEMEGVR